MLSARLSRELDEARNVNCDKKKKKIKGKGKLFRSLSMLDTCPLSDQELSDVESEIFKTKHKKVVDNFLD